MTENTLIFSLFAIFFGAAILSTAALYTRQSLLVAYIILGIVLGPWGLKLVADAGVVQHIGDVGIVFLLFLLGLHLHPQKLFHMLRKALWVGIISSLLFAALSGFIAYLFGFSVTNCLIIGAAMMFSSTIIGLKLLPTTVLHHQHTGELVISVLLLQDLLAIIVLLLLHAAAGRGLHWEDILQLIIAIPFLLGFAFLCERFILVKLFARFDRIHEYMFLLAIGWCLAMSVLAHLFGLSFEVGAFIAGVSIAASPISFYIAENLKPVRDFFLVMFFFSVGASFNLHYLGAVALPAVILAATVLVLKPLIFRYLLRQVSEGTHIAWEIGIRLGQASEFSLLVAYLAANSALIADATSYLIQATTILTFIASSYWVVLKYPTPVAISEKLRRD